MHSYYKYKHVDIYIWYTYISTSTFNKGIPPNALLFASEFHVSSQPAEGPPGFAIAPAKHSPTFGNRAGYNICLLFICSALKGRITMTITMYDMYIYIATCSRKMIWYKRHRRTLLFLTCVAENSVMPVVPCGCSMSSWYASHTLWDWHQVQVLDKYQP